MTGPEHYREAEHLAVIAKELMENGQDALAGPVHDAAQVHATLALTMATALQHHAANPAAEWLKAGES